MHKFLFSTLIYCGLFSNLSVAGIVNDVPSCYQANKLQNPSPVDKEIFVLVDQTTAFDAKLKAELFDSVKDIVSSPSTSFVIADFSSFSQGRYVEIISAGTLEPLIGGSERNDISVRLLKTFDECMQKQKNYGEKLAATALNKALSGSSSDIAKSDIFASLKDISNRVKDSKAKNKIVLLASDMLENSSISSFYANQSVRKINSEKELKLVSDNHMYGDFGGARVFVIGAGLLSEDLKQPKGVYRSPQIMQALSDFWKIWFEKSNSTLVEFGQPALLSPVK